MEVAFETRKQRIIEYIGEMDSDQALGELEDWLFEEPFSDDELALVDERIADNEANPNASVPWEQFTDMIKNAQ